MKQGRPLSPIFFRHFPEISCNAVKQKLRKELRGTQIVKEGMKVSLFNGDVIIYVETSKNWLKKSLGTNKPDRNPIARLQDARLVCRSRLLSYKPVLKM